MPAASNSFCAVLCSGNTGSLYRGLRRSCSCPLLRRRAQHLIATLVSASVMSRKNGYSFHQSTFDVERVCPAHIVFDFALHSVKIIVKVSARMRPPFCRRQQVILSFVVQAAYRRDYRRRARSKDFFECSVLRRFNNVVDGQLPS